MRRTSIAGLALAAACVGGIAVTPVQACLTHDAASLAACLCPDDSHAGGLKVTDSLTKSTRATSTRSDSKRFDVAPARLDGGGSGQGAATVTVHVFDFDFSATRPNGIVDPTINAGDTINWILDGGFHTATSVSGSAESWDSGVLPSAPGSFSHTFNTPGVYQYYCLFHGGVVGSDAVGMAGTITVLAIPEPATLSALVAGSSLLLRRRRPR